MLKLYVCVYVCLCVRMSVHVSCIVWCWQVERKDKASKEGKSSPSTSKKSEVCVCVCVCACTCVSVWVLLVTTTWLPPTPPTPVEAGAPPPHTVPGSPVKSQFQCTGQTDTGRRSPAPSGPGGQRRTPSSTSFSDASYDQCSQLQPLPPR